MSGGAGSMAHAAIGNGTTPPHDDAASRRYARKGVVRE
jgi:hypothetical protein